MPLKSSKTELEGQQKNGTLIWVLNSTVWKPCEDKEIIEYKYAVKFNY